MAKLWRTTGNGREGVDRLPILLIRVSAWTDGSEAVVSPETCDGASATMSGQ